MCACPCSNVCNDPREQSSLWVIASFASRILGSYKHLDICCGCSQREAWTDYFNAPDIGRR